MPKIESEKIDCSHRPCTRPAPRGKIESVRPHSEVIEQFDSFLLLKLLFLVRNWHCWSRKAFPHQMTPQSREKNCENGRFRQRWQAWKVVRSIAAVRRRPRTQRKQRCSFAFFESFLWHFNKKQRAEVIFRLSRPVSCKNQENGSGKQWSLHAPLNIAIVFVQEGLTWCCLVKVARPSYNPTKKKADFRTRQHHTTQESGGVWFFIAATPKHHVSVLCFMKIWEKIGGHRIHFFGNWGRKLQFFAGFLYVFK